MTQFNFTDLFEDFDSSAIDYIWYDEPTAAVFVEYTDGYDIYRFDGVPRRVVENVAEADSVGRAFASSIKAIYGPSTNLHDAEPVEREDDETKEFSLQTPVAAHDGTAYTGALTDATKEFSLQTPAAPASEKTGGLSLVDGSVVFTLYFTVDGGSEVKTHTLRNVENFDEAVDTLHGFAESAGLELKIQEVRATFE